MLHCVLVVQLRWDRFDLWSHEAISNDTIKLLSFSCCIYPYKVEQFPQQKGNVPSTYVHSHCCAVSPAGKGVKQEDSNIFMKKRT